MCSSCGDDYDTLFVEKISIKYDKTLSIFPAIAKYIFGTVVKKGFG